MACSFLGGRRSAEDNNRSGGPSTLYDACRDDIERRRALRRPPLVRCKCYIFFLPVQLCR